MEDKSEIIKRLKFGVLLRDYSGRLTYEIHQSDAKEYFGLRKEIAKTFGLYPVGVTINTPDEIFRTYIRGFKRVGIEWDWASGFSVVAKNKQAESLVAEIGHYLETSYKT